jgi:hypothetical protein
MRVLCGTVLQPGGVERRWSGRRPSYIERSELRHSEQRPARSSNKNSVSFPTPTAAVVVTNIAGGREMEVCGQVVLAVKT